MMVYLIYWIDHEKVGVCLTDHEKFRDDVIDKLKTIFPAGADYLSYPNDTELLAYYPFNKAKINNNVYIASNYN